MAETKRTLKNKPYVLPEDQMAIANGEKERYSITPRDENDERIDYVVERVVDTARISEGEKEAIKNLIGAFRESEAELKTCIHSYNEQFKKREELEKELNSLGKGTTFKDVEKLRKDIHTLELAIYNTREEIRNKTEAMQTEQEIDHAGLREKQENLRTLKKQCEDQFKRYKKELNDKLKSRRTQMELNEALREEHDVNKTQWPKKVKQLTKEDEDVIPGLLEDLRVKQEKNIQKMETSISELQEVIDQKYGGIEEEIRELKDNVELKRIGLHNLEMARINRIAYIHALETTSEYKFDEITAK